MADGTWLTDEQQRTWRALAGVCGLLPAALDAQLQREENLTHFAYWTMAMLSEASDRSLQLSELAAMSRSSLSRLSHLMGRLERAGYVRRQRSTDDARATLAILTDAGYAKVVRAAPGHVATVRSLVFDQLTREQASELGEICTRLMAELDPERRVHRDGAPPTTPPDP